MSMSVSIGEKLRQERKARSLSLEDVSQATYMRVRYLAALESGNLEALPSLVQARGFLRAYAEFLDLDSAALLDELDQEEALDVSASATSLEVPVDKSDAAPIQVDLIFQNIGKILKEQRELLGLSLDDVSRYTHLRTHSLNLMETGQFDELPSTVQARGMLNNYSSFIGLDPEPILLEFAEALQVRLAARQVKKISRTVTQKPPPELGKLTARRIFSRETVMTISIAILLIVFMVWGIIRILDARKTAQEVYPTPPSIADVLLATATITETPTPQPPTPTIPQAPLVVENLETPIEGAEVTLDAVQVGTVQVYVTIRQRAWMRVSVDGSVEFDGRVIPGSAYQFSGKEQVEILTGNAAALQIFYQQQDLGPLGNYGEVVDRVFTLEGILLPTETITPTPTETPQTSPTAAQTGSPTNTPESGT